MACHDYREQPVNMIETILLCAGNGCLQWKLVGLQKFETFIDKLNLSVEAYRIWCQVTI